MAYRIDFSRIQQLDANGDVYAGGKLYVYANETTTPKALFSDRDGLVSAANPVVADSAGRFPVRYVAADDLVTLVFKTSAGAEIWSDNDIEPVPNVDNADLANYVPRDGSLAMTGPLNFAEGSTVTAAATINLDAAGGNMVHIAGGTGISAMTLTQGAWRLLVFEDALTITHSSNLRCVTGADIVVAASDTCLVVGEGSGVTRIVWFQRVSGKALREAEEILIAVGDESTAITAGTAKITFRMPFAMTLDAIPRASLTAAQTSGTLVTIDINEAGSSILSTKLTIDNNETTSATAATPAALSDTTLADNAVITIDIDACDGSTAAAGLKVLLRGYRAN